MILVKIFKNFSPASAMIGGSSVKDMPFLPHLLWRLSRSGLFQLADDRGFIPGAHVAKNFFSSFIEKD